MSKFFDVAMGAGHGGRKPNGGYSTAGKRTPDGEPEWDFNNKVVLAAMEYLAQYDEIRVFRMDDPTGHTDVPLKERTDKAKEWGVDALVSVHHNAYKGVWGNHSGTSVFTHNDGPQPKSTKLAEMVLPRMVEAYGLKNRGIKRANFHMLRESPNGSPAILLEGAFMDSTIDIVKMRDDNVLRNVGYGVGEGIAEYFGLEIKPRPENKLYRVRKTWADAKSQIGAFKELENAKELADEKPGYKVFDSEGSCVYNPSLANEEVYRVRKSWEDVASQIGAFKDAENAKKLADSEPGYKVFNSSGTCIYEPEVKESKKEEVDHAGHRDILGESEASLEQMIYFIEAKVPHAPKDIAKHFYEVGVLEGVRGDVALAQAIKETGWFKFGGDVKPEQNNFCGLGATGGGNPGHSFATVREGVTAQIQHLKGYATDKELELECVDPRYKYIKPLGKAPHVEDLAGKWAVPGYEKANYSSLEEAMIAEDAYGHQIMNIVDSIVATKVPQMEAPKEEEAQEEEKIDVSLLNKVLKLIYELLLGWTNKK